MASCDAWRSMEAVGLMVAADRKAISSHTAGRAASASSDAARRRRYRVTGYPALTQAAMPPVTL